MYVAVKGGEAAIENAHTLLAETRRGNPMVPELSVAQIREQQSLGLRRQLSRWVNSHGCHSRIGSARPSSKSSSLAAIRPCTSCG